MNLLRCLGDCLLLRGPGRDVMDPTAGTLRGGGSAGAKVGRVHAPVATDPGAARFPERTGLTRE